MCKTIEAPWIAKENGLTRLVFEDDFDSLDTIDLEKLSRAIGCLCVEIGALKGEGCFEAAEKAVALARNHVHAEIPHVYNGSVEHALAHIEEVTVHNLPEEQQRWYAIKIFERDEKVKESLQIDEKTLAHIETDIATAEKELGEDADKIKSFRISIDQDGNVSYAVELLKEMAENSKIEKKEDTSAEKQQERINEKRAERKKAEKERQEKKAQEKAAKKAGRTRRSKKATAEATETPAAE